MPTPPKIALIVFDFDGVMTDNLVWVMEDGREAVACSRADGLGFKILRQHGLQLLIMSTETNPVVRARARKLKVPVLQSVEDKGTAIRNYCTKHGLELSQVAFVGNHVNDLPAMRLVGYPIAVGDAHASVKKIAWRVLRTVGGRGVSCEIAEKLLRIKLDA